MIKVEDNQTMLKLEDVKDNVRSRYSFKQEVGEDGTYYKIRFDTPEGKGVIHIYVTLDGEGQEILEYYFSGGGMYHHDGNGNHNGEHSGNGNGHGDDDDKGHHGNPDHGEDEDYEEEFEDLDDF